MTRTTSPALKAAKFTVRPARAEDAKRVRRLIAPYVKQRKLLDRTEEELATLLVNGFVAEAGRRLVGVAAIEVYSKKLAEIQCLAVAEDFHGRGVGKELVNKCVERARELRIFELMAISASEGFLQACGFDFSLPDQKKALFFQTRERY